MKQQYYSYAGVALGLLLTLFGTIKGQVFDAIDAAVIVNGQSISRTQFEHLKQQIQAEKPQISSKSLLTKLIDEELLLQQAMRFKLHRFSSAAKATLVDEMTQKIVIPTRAEPIAESDLEKFYNENRDFFQTASRVQLRRIFIETKNASETQSLAQQAYQALKQGNLFADVKKKFNRNEVVQLPLSFLPLAKVLDYLGPELTQRVKFLKSPVVLKPFRLREAIQIVEVLNIETAPHVPTLKSIRNTVINEFRKRRSDNKLREYLEELRSESDITIAKDL